MLRQRRTAHSRQRVPHRVNVRLPAVRRSSSVLRSVYRLQKQRPAATPWRWLALAPPRIRNALPLTKLVALKKMRVAAKFAKKPSVLKKPAASLKPRSQRLRLLQLKRLLLPHPLRPKPPRRKLRPSLLRPLQRLLLKL